MELAQTAKERRQGLMFRNHLDKDKGMLFIFPKERFHNFWMKDTHIPLDIIWISKDKRVVFMVENVQPCLTARCPVISPEEKALYALEVNAGIARDIGLNIGDKLQF